MSSSQTVFTTRWQTSLLLFIHTLTTFLPTLKALQQITETPNILISGCDVILVQLFLKLLLLLLVALQENIQRTGVILMAMANL